MARNKKNIVVMGGGTGSFAVLSGLRDSGHNVSAIVTMADHGGSSGLLRDELGVLPPGDIRQCLVALSAAPETLRELFTHRFRRGSLKGHTLGNLFLSGFEDLTGSFEDAVRTASEVLQIRGRVLPVTLKKVELCARLNDGSALVGEPVITESETLQRIGVKRLYLKPSAPANAKAIEAILAADLFVLAPGNLYSSLIPNFLVGGIPEAIVESRAKKVYVCNLMTKRGQTEGFSVHDFVKELERWAGRPLFDTVLYNTAMPPEDLLAKYRKDGEPVTYEKRKDGEVRHIYFIGAPLLSNEVFTPSRVDPLALQRSLIRHDPKRLAGSVLQLLSPLPIRIFSRLARR